MSTQSGEEHSKEIARFLAHYPPFDRMVRAVEKVRERLLRAAAALEQAGIPYAVTGGNAVAAWVSRVDEAAVRTGVALLLAGLIAGISACSPATPSVATLAPDALITQAAETVAAQFTQTAAGAPQATNTPAPLPTDTLAPVSPTADAQQPTLPPAATNTQPAAQTNPTQSAAGDMASFVEDVTVLRTPAGPLERRVLRSLEGNPAPALDSSHRRRC